MIRVGKHFEDNNGQKKRSQKKTQNTELRCFYVEHSEKKIKKLSNKTYD